MTMQFPFMIIEVTQLTKTFGAFTAVNEVSFALKEGEILGLLGPNGAGKTTTILMLLGLITPTSGSIRIFNRGYDRDRERILAGMNFCAPYISFPGRLSVYENLMVFARLYQVPRPGRKIMELLLRFGIEPLKNRPVLLLSSGENTRVALCKALLNNPRLLCSTSPPLFWIRRSPAWSNVSCASFERSMAPRSSTRPTICLTRKKCAVIWCFFPMAGSSPAAQRWRLRRPFSTTNATSPRW